MKKGIVGGRMRGFESRESEEKESDEDEERAD